MRLLMAVGTAVLLVGCLDAQTVTCGDGTICPRDTRCDDVHGGCVTDEQVAACAEAADGDECGIGDDPAAGVCDVGICRHKRCGDHYVTDLEQCDTTLPADADDCLEYDFQDPGPVVCNDTCQIDLSACTGYCGDGFQNGDEQCDGGDFGGMDCTDFGFYVEKGLQCSLACTVVTSECSETCGDDERTGPEECDGPDLALTDCTDLGFYFQGGLACNEACGFDASGCMGYCGDRSRQLAQEYCEGKTLDSQSCLDFGYERGELGCSALCLPDVSGCRGAGWEQLSVGFPAEFYAIWGTGPTDVFAVGSGGTIVHYDGIAWSIMPTGTLLALTGVSGTGSSDVVAVGDGGTILHYDGSAWSPVASGTVENLRDVWVSPGEAFAVGDSGMTVHRVGTTWTPIPSGVTGNLQAVWSDDAGTFVAAGIGQPAVVWDPGLDAWIEQLEPSRAVDFWGTSAADVHGVWQRDLHQLDSGTWSEEASEVFTTSMEAIWGTGPADLYAAGQYGAIWHFDGLVWREQTSSTTSTLHDLWGSGAGDVFAAGANGVILHWAGRVWGAYGRAPSNLFDVTATAAGTVLAIDGQNDLLVLAGDAGTTPATAPAGNFTGVWADSTDDIFVFGYGDTLQRWQGSSWTAIPTGTGTGAFYDAWGTGPDNLYVVGAGGTIVHRTAGGTVAMTSNTSNDLDAIWGSGPNDLWAVGGGSLLHGNGSSWTNQVPPIATPRDIWGSAADDVFLVGFAGAIAHWDGTAWTATVAPVPDDLYGVWGTGRYDVYAVGLTGTVLHWDGFAWTRMRTHTAFGLWAVGGTREDIFAVGEIGTIARLARRCLAAELDCADGEDDDCDGLIDASDADCVAGAGGLCANPLPLGCDGSEFHATSVGQSAIDRYACDPMLEVGRESSFVFETDTAADVTVGLQTAGADLDLIVMAAGAGGGCEPRAGGCIGASSGDEPDTVSFHADADTAYYIVVDGYGGATGEFMVYVSCL